MTMMMTTIIFDSKRQTTRTTSCSSCSWVPKGRNGMKRCLDAATNGFGLLKQFSTEVGRVLLGIIATLISYNKVVLVLSISPLTCEKEEEEKQTMSVSGFVNVLRSLVASSSTESPSSCVTLYRRGTFEEAFPTMEQGNMQ